LEIKPARDDALALPAGAHHESADKLRQRFRHPAHFLKHPVSLPRASADWTNEDTFFFPLKEIKEELGVLIIKTTAMKTRSSDSLEHMWVIRGLRK